MSIDRLSPGIKHDQTSNFDPEARSNQYLKKKNLQTEQTTTSFYTSSIMSLNPSKESSQPIAAPAPLKVKKAGALAWLSDTWDAITDKTSQAWNWITDKTSSAWNSFLEFIGVRIPPRKITERDQTARAKIYDRRSPLDIEDDFKYLDFSRWIL